MEECSDEPILNNAAGDSVSLSAAPFYELLYVNKLAMMVVASPELGFTSTQCIQALGNKTAIDAKMKSTVQIRFPRRFEKR